MIPNIFNHKSGKKLSPFQRFIVNTLNWISTKGFYLLGFIGISCISYSVISLTKVIFVKLGLLNEFYILIIGITIFIGINWVMDYKKL